MLFRPLSVSGLRRSRVGALYFSSLLSVSPRSAGGPHSGAWRYNRRQIINPRLTVHRHFANALICLSRSTRRYGIRQPAAMSQREHCRPNASMVHVQCLHSAHSTNIRHHHGAGNLTITCVMVCRGDRRGRTIRHVSIHGRGGPLLRRSTPRPHPLITGR